ncbi:hypothetical protein Gotri_027919 [Gossypium trilobum]|uniref:Uncharacterized protein n=1 Tax=Gossypium trilobum TaxID=34281 RepID=A0A7J9FQL5_9ROSI|nr:hypothetical protein [Gossypium trilobum]
MGKPNQSTGMWRNGIETIEGLLESVLGKSGIIAKKAKCGNGEGLDECPIRIVRRKLVEPFKLIAVNNPDVFFLSKTKLQANEFEHIRVRCSMDDYFIVDPDGRKDGLSLLWRDRGLLSVRIGLLGDFNEVMDDAEKCGGRRRPRVAMDNFRKVLNDLGLVDIKPDNGWFTWTNNRDGDRVVKERLDKFMVSPNWFKACWGKKSEAKDMTKRVWD